jgi:hypothetical protein
MIVLSIARLHELLKYEPLSGKLCWRERDRNLSGLEAGGVDRRDGYRRVRIDGRMCLTHRVIIAMVEREWPKAQVDHINGNRSDNRLSNLRSVEQRENLLNKKRYRSNTSGVTGVNWHKQHRKWCVSLSCGGRKKFIGLFEGISDAIAARKCAERLAGFHPNHGRD